MNYAVKDINLASAGKKKIEWAENDMPVLKLVREKFEKEKPLAGKKMSACLQSPRSSCGWLQSKF